MAIKTFKEIIDNKGYRISSKDRDIFEEGSLRSFFGMSENDYIEFIVYDANDNQLPLQITDAGDTAPVKYIPITTETIRNYFMINEGSKFQQGELPSEYFIDVERLLRESGYDNGIFKTQITLINRRLGTFDDRKKSKMWIKEISPSRTEIRLLPQRNKTSQKTDILQRLQIFKNDGEFRDDNIYYVDTFVSSINPSLIELFIQDSYSDKWLNKLQDEFNISIQDFSTKVYRKFQEAIEYEFNNRISSIKDGRYGQKKDGEPTLELSVKTIREICSRRLVEIIDYYLPERITEDTQSDIDLQQSIDEVGEVLQRRESDTTVQPSVPNVVFKYQKVDSVEQIEFDTKLDDEFKNLPDNDGRDVPMVRPNGNRRTIVRNNTDEDLNRRERLLINEQRQGINIL